MAFRFNISKKVLIISWFITVCACENQVNINLPGDPIPVAYCLLDMQDSIQKIRINYTYLLHNDGLKITQTGAEVMTKQTHSAYLQRFAGDEGKEILYFSESEIMSNENTETDNPLIILESKGNILVNSFYELYVLKNDKEILNASTISVGPQKILDPLFLPGRELTLTPVQGYMLRWAPVPNARVYQAIIYFNFQESLNQEIVNGKLKIPLQININSEQVHNISQFFSGNHFYKAISEGIDQISGVRRKALNLDFEVLAGGEELSIYLGRELNGTSDFGSLEAYSSFDDGEGIFSSRSSTFIKDIQLSYITHDSLASNVLTRNLGFIKHNEDL